MVKKISMYGVSWKDLVTPEEVIAEHSRKLSKDFQVKIILCMVKVGKTYTTQEVIDGHMQKQR